jgi:hypothetical protein
LIAGRVGWIQCEFGQETFARRVTGGDLFEFKQVSSPGIGIFMMRSRCGSYQRRARSRSTGHSEYRRLPNVSTNLCQSSPARGGVGRPASAAIEFYVFDMLASDGDDLRKLPLTMPRVTPTSRVTCRNGCVMAR